MSLDEAVHHEAAVADDSVAFLLRRCMLASATDGLKVAVNDYLVARSRPIAETSRPRPDHDPHAEED